MKLLTFEVFQQVADNGKIQRPVRQGVSHKLGRAVAIDTRHDRVHLLTQAAKDRRLQHDNPAQLPPRPGNRHVRDRREGDGCEEPGERLKLASSSHRRPGPCEKAIGVHGGADVRPGQCQPLSEIEGRAELFDSFLPRSNLTGLGWGRQPPCKQVLTRAGSRQREQFEHRGTAEQIQVVCVHVAIVTEAIAWLTRAHPPVLEPGQTALVEGDAPCGAVTCPKHLVVSPDEPGEERRRSQQPPEGDPSAPDEEGGDYPNGERRQTRVTETRVSHTEDVTGRTPCLQARQVFVRGTGWHVSLFSILSRRPSA